MARTRKTPLLPTGPLVGRKQVDVKGYWRTNKNGGRTWVRPMTRLTAKPGFVMANKKQSRLPFSVSPKIAPSEVRPRVGRAVTDELIRVGMERVDMAPGRFTCFRTCGAEDMEAILEGPIFTYGQKKYSLYVDADPGMDPVPIRPSPNAVPARRKPAKPAPAKPAPRVAWKDTIDYATAARDAVDMLHQHLAGDVVSESMIKSLSASVRDLIRKGKGNGTIDNIQESMLQDALKSTKPAKPVLSIKKKNKRKGGITPRSVGVAYTPDGQAYIANPGQGYVYNKGGLPVVGYVGAGWRLGLNRNVRKVVNERNLDRVTRNALLDEGGINAIKSWRKGPGKSGLAKYPKKPWRKLNARDLQIGAMYDLNMEDYSNINDAGFRL